MGRSAILYTALALFVFSGCSVQGLFTKSKKEDHTLLLAVILLSQPQGPCSNVSYPAVGATSQAGYGVSSGFSVLTGRVVTQSGASVIAANIVAVSSPTDYVATFTGLGGDGSFYLSGVNPGTSYTLAVEPIGSDFAGRIDTFIECYQTPRSFTAGWYNGSGATTGSSMSGTPFTSPSAGNVSDLGVIRIPE
jgi:hypothetical protein